MNKVFIAGGTGFLGAAIAQNFADAGIEVVVSSRKKQDATGDWLEAYSQLIKVAKVDLLDAAALEQVFAHEKFDGVLFTAQTHQAAQTRAKANEIFPILLNCLEIARTNKVKRFIFGGSMAVYSQDPSEPQNEQFRFPPQVTEPAAAKFEIALKRAMEIIALDYGQPFQGGMSAPVSTEKSEPHELEVAVLRSPIMFGPRQSFWESACPLGIGAHFAAGKIDNFKERTGFMNLPIEHLWPLTAAAPSAYVKDAADCFRAAMIADELKHQIYNVFGGTPYNPRRQFEAFVRAAPHCANRLGITAEDLPDITHDSTFNGQLLEQDFGWKPKFTLEAAMVDYIGWLKDHPI